ncbi:Rad1-domain-containing protein [Punctularia strigosozonata HHB-11173 SS5]|uniref:Rad1-domain-containing protein n=1 Tax=Punctularia strigosozonata (strain HHB-11173) TaxID=741275 RepID=UPI00044166C0|nr:Rad1-domain-containing protein [Punctularia strigosozonata HHB-11173 SS5]EIN08008.1 Rad1-domain-containing protein [Punctularia strigosozonata HHB-11173 SS5]
MSQAQAQNDPPPILAASVHDVRYFASIMRGINFSNRATLTARETGLTIHVEEARTLLATAYIFAGMFDEYQYSPDVAAPPSQPATPRSTALSAADVPETIFEVPLNTLVECLNIFGTAGPPPNPNSTKARTAKLKSAEDEEGGGGEDRNQRGPLDKFIASASGDAKSTAMRMTFAGLGHPLSLHIVEESGGPTAICELSTLDPETVLELPFDSDATVLKIILNPSWLRDALSELDPSCDKITFIGNPPPVSAAPQRASANRTPKPSFSIKAAGTFGSSEMDYPNDKEVIESIECSATVSFTYRFSHLSRVLRALYSCTKTSLRIDDEGLLSMQFLMPTGKIQPMGTSNAFIEFRCLSLDEDM